MSPREMRRLELYEAMIERLGDEAATTLMEFLPPGGWDNVATKDDARATVALAEKRLSARISALDRRISALEGKVTALEGKIDGGVAELRGELIDFRGEIKFDMARQTRTMVFTMVGIAITIWLALLLPAVAS